MRLLTLAVVAALLVACGKTPPPTGPDTASPAGTPAASAPATSNQPTESGQPRPSSLPTRTDTEWGTIWDALPATFPAYPGAIATETRAGPVTAELAVPTDLASAVAWYRRALEAAGYRTEGVSEPLEDGSVVIDSAGSASECRVRVTLTPLSGTTHATIWFAASCPFQ